MYYTYYMICFNIYAVENSLSLMLYDDVIKVQTKCNFFWLSFSWEQVKLQPDMGLILQSEKNHGFGAMQLLKTNHLQLQQRISVVALFG